MVIMSGILSYGLWLPQAHVSVNCFTSKLSMYKLAILIFTVKVENTSFIYSENLRTEATKWLKEKSYFRLYIPEPIWGTYYNTWHSPTTETFCGKIRNE